MKRRSVIGERFGRLTIISQISKKGKANLVCICECGEHFTAYRSNIVTGKTKSCGCLNVEIVKNRSFKHGRIHKGEYTSWNQMKQRCQNKNNPAYKYYGARGISVCKKWQSFEGFHEDMGKRPRGHSIERINNNGNYCKSNCKWIPKTEQSKNRRGNIMITHNGVTKGIPEWSKDTGIASGTIKMRIHRGWSHKRAIGF